MPLLAFVAALRSRGVTFTLDRHAELVIDGKLSAEGLELVEAHRIMLTNIVIGRLTGHAPGTCSSCGAVAMISLTNSSGTRRSAPSVGWPRCRLTPRCEGLVVVDEADREGVGKRRRPRKLIGPPRPTYDMRWRE